MVVQDSAALQTAILAYNQWKAYRSGNPDGAFQEKSTFRTEEFLSHGEFDSRIYQPISAFVATARKDR